MFDILFFPKIVSFTK